ncbi:MAG: nucleoside transporter [Candidatus Aminicenantes bacterium RBG_16_63_14]|nr:MAG: nucleoside transporter [Candidatus Aminicenantes bacterium RBG_16_63_14]OGD26722.1 MAG: nucleoside transporter [Candidatus Aminicenantes bacterium RBG_19FT_COMBO_65_30]
MTAWNLVSFLGIFVLAGVAWLFSSNRKVVNSRALLWGIGLQLLIGLFVFVLPAGTTVFLWVNKAVVAVLDSATAGTKFVFGRVALPPGTVNEAGETSLGYSLAFQALPTIIFFAALLGALYHVRVMPFFVRLFARVFTRTMRISGAEALSVSSNIFVGVESALVVKPHLADMTRSELGTIITAGMGTIASTTLGLYVLLLQKDIPMIAGHLVSASFISAPACVVMAKLIMPETEKPLTLGVDVKPHYERDENLMMAIIKGAQDGLKLLGGIITLLIAFLGLLALLNLGLGWAGGLLNGLFGWHVRWSLEALLGYLFYPLTLVLGIPPSDALAVAKVIGERTVTTEVVSFNHLSALISSGALRDPRSAIIASYALCGFAHVASLAIFVGGTGALAPTRLRDLSRLGFRALLAATLACLMTGAVAGTFYTGSSLLFGR